YDGYHLTREVALALCAIAARALTATRPAIEHRIADPIVSPTERERLGRRPHPGPRLIRMHAIEIRPISVRKRAGLIRPSTLSEAPSTLAPCRILRKAKRLTRPNLIRIIEQPRRSRSRLEPTRIMRAQERMRKLVKYDCRELALRKLRDIEIDDDLS